ncbi:hypothetical protein N2152v2_009553 [Parachlorella kessleri]
MSIHPRRPECQVRQSPLVGLADQDTQQPNLTRRPSTAAEPPPAEDRAATGSAAADPKQEAGPAAEVRQQAAAAADVKQEAAATAEVKVEEQEVATAEAAGGAQTAPTGDEQLASVEPPSDEQLVSRLRDLLKLADLSTVTERSLRRTLEGEFGVELAAKKPLIRAEIEKFLAEQDGEEGGAAEGAEQGGDDREAEHEEASGTSGRQRRRGGRAGGAALGCRLSPELAAFLEMDSCPRPQVVKKLWEYIKANNLQNPADRRQILLDDKLKTIFPGNSVSMFKMNKHLSKHCKVDDRDPVSDEEGEEGGSEEASDGEEDEEERQPRKRTKAAAAAPRAKPRKKDAAGGERKLGGFQKPVRVSDALAAWCGKTEISRPELTKFFYAYVNEHDLKDPSNKQFVLCDETLKHLTGEARLRAFGFQSLMKHHFLKD